jgi:hypothetical protein
VHTSILGVGFGILQVDLLVRDVHVSANDDRFLGVQTLHILPAKQIAGSIVAKSMAPLTSGSGKSRMDFFSTVYAIFFY